MAMRFMRCYRSISEIVAPKPPNGLSTLGVPSIGGPQRFRHRVVAAPDRVPAINPTGNAKLATAGTGDVPAGMIAARLAAGATPFDAAIEGVYSHGLAADRWPDSGLTFLNSDLILDRSVYLIWRLRWVGHLHLATA